MTGRVRRAVGAVVREVVALLAPIDRLDWLYLVGTVAGFGAFLASPAPWLAGLWLAGCAFVAVRMGMP